MMRKDWNSTMVIFDGGLYGLLPEDKSGFFYQILRPRKTFFSKALCKICLMVGIVRSFWFGPWKEHVGQASRIIIFSAWYDRFVYRYILQKNPSCKVKIYYWNKILPKDRIGRLLKTGADVWSFDPSDCKEFGLRFNPQFYVKKYFPTGTEKTKQDAVFVGQAKNRLSLILDAKSDLDRVGATSQFIIVRTKGCRYTAEESKYLVEATIPYHDMLKAVFSSKAIVDICIPGQEGLTLRVLESLFYGKKLITNNVSILAYDFYSPDRVFILGRDSASSLKDFLDVPLAAESESRLEKYGFDAWLERFFTEALSNS